MWGYDYLIFLTKFFTERLEGERDNLGENKQIQKIDKIKPLIARLRKTYVKS